MRNFFLYFLLLLIYACGEHSSTADADNVEKWFDTDTLMIWNSDAESETRNKIYQPKDSIPLIQPLINGINQAWPEGKLMMDRQSRDTLHVRLGDSLWLTEKIGNAGAEQYLTFAAMNLLEIKGVRVVCFILPEGSHASSSCWNKRDFIDWKESVK
jgi:hypothetical protein